MKIKFALQSSITFNNNTGLPKVISVPVGKTSESFTISAEGIQNLSSRYKTGEIIFIPDNSFEEAIVNKLGLVTSSDPKSEESSTELVGEVIPPDVLIKSEEPSAEEVSTEVEEVEIEESFPTEESSTEVEEVDTEEPASTDEDGGEEVEEVK